jgi:SHS2 domain-containing protein
VSDRVVSARWEHFPHDADVGIRGFGATIAEAFQQAALALTAAIADPAAVRSERPVPIQCEAASVDDLFYDWINSIVYEMAVRRMLFSRYDVTLDGATLRARAWGEPVDVARHQPAVEVKGATYTELRVERTTSGWLAQCVVDV